MVAPQPFYENEFAIDYVRFVVRGDADLVMQLVQQLNDRHDPLLAGEAYKNGGRKCYPVPPTSHEPAGRVWEAWGPSCAFVYGLDFDAWAPRLNRLDVRRVMPGMDALAFDCMWAAFRASGKARTLARYSSAPRVKRGGRNAGGDGIGLGSHKSDMRVTFYRRQGEPSVMEVQAQHESLQRQVQIAQALCEGEVDSYDTWHKLTGDVMHKAERRVAATAAMPFEQLLEDARNATADALLAQMGAGTGQMPAA